MEFFDRKEEVINLELTPYGKRILSQGEFKPVYYAFYDDDIIYDSEYGGSSEAQKDTEDRIKSIPRPKAQPILDGIESKFNQINKSLTYDLEKKLEKLAKPGTKQNIYGLPNPIGSAEIGNQYAPAWDIKFLQASASSSTDVISGSYGFIKIPQIEVDLYYDTSISEIETNTSSTKDVTFNNPGYVDSTNVSLSKVFPDGTFIKLDKDYILLDIKELNGLFDKENFDIEIFEIETANNQEQLKQLKFLNEDIEIQHGEIIYDPNLKKDINLDDTYVEYYFDVRMDDEIEKPSLSETQRQIISLPKSDPDAEDEPCLDETV